MARKTIAVDSDMIDRATDELVRPYNSTRKEPEDNEEGTEHNKKNSRDSKPIGWMVI